MPAIAHLRRATILTHTATGAADARGWALSPAGKTITPRPHQRGGVDRMDQGKTHKAGRGRGRRRPSRKWKGCAEARRHRTVCEAPSSKTGGGRGRRRGAPYWTVDSGGRLRPRLSTSATRRMAAGLAASGGRAADGDDGSVAVGEAGAAAAVAAADGPSVDPHSFAHDGPPGARPPSPPPPPPPAWPTHAAGPQRRPCPPATPRPSTPRSRSAPGDGGGGGGVRPGTQRATHGSRGARGAERRSRKATNSSGS